MKQYMIYGGVYIYSVINVSIINGANGEWVQRAVKEKTKQNSANICVDNSQCDII